MADEQKDEGFKVTDRRAFNPDGSPREDTQVTEELRPKTANEEPRDAATDRVIEFPGGGRREEAAGDRPQPGKEERGKQPDLPPPTFASFINMLAIEAAMHLGLVQNPVEGGRHIDLPAARHMIDTLGMLQEKTAGNLTAGETDMIETILSDLRMQFVEVSRKR
jgi:hypothetical protein